MKVGDKVPVNIGPHEVAQAEVKEINGSEAVLIVPARRVVMGIRTELTDLPGTEPETESIVVGVEQPQASAVVDDTPTQQNSAETTDSAPVVEAVAPASAPVAEGVAQTPAPTAQEATPEAPANESGTDG